MRGIKAIRGDMFAHGVPFELVQELEEAARVASDVDEVVCDACGAKAHIFEGAPCTACHEGFMRKPVAAPSEEDASQADYDALAKIMPNPDEYMRLNRIWRELAILRAQHTAACKELANLDEQIDLRMKAEQETASLRAQLTAPVSEADQHPADSGHPCDDCGHSDEGCSRNPEMRCLGWVTESVRAALESKE